MARTSRVSPPQTSGRLVSLDAVRGLTMALMVVVNTPGDPKNVYAPLRHAEWNGWTPTDLVFPFFLFIVGVAITLSSRSTSVVSILKRAVVIFLVGLFLNAFPEFELSSLRIPGVLQRIALCYAAAALLWRWTQRHQRRAAILAVVAAALMLSYWAALTLITVPGGTAGDLTSGNDLGSYIDRVLMPGHLLTPAMDPEGLLSTLPAIATTLLGTLAGLWVRGDQPLTRKAVWLAAAAVGAIAIGLIWDPTFPINKRLWTSSYVIFTAGGAALLLALCYWLIDVRGWRAWSKPFVVLGMNAIVLYVLASMLADVLLLLTVTSESGSVVSAAEWLYTTLFEPYFEPRIASLTYALAFLGVLFLVLLVMYRRRIFVRA